MRIAASLILAVLVTSLASGWAQATTRTSTVQGQQVLIHADTKSGATNPGGRIGVANDGDVAVEYCQYSSQEWVRVRLNGHTGVVSKRFLAGDAPLDACRERRPA